MFEQDQVISRGSGLPADNDKDYDYKPRPPKAIPPISTHEFQVALTACQSCCLLSFFHRCRRPSSRRIAMQRIPKKSTEWEIKGAVDETDYAWGLEVRHRLSFFKVLGYNILILLGPFTFWAWWQGKVNLLDLQNASIPATVVVSLLGMFYTLSGIFLSLRDGI